MRTRHLCPENLAEKRCNDGGAASVGVDEGWRRGCHTAGEKLQLGEQLDWNRRSPAPVEEESVGNWKDRDRSFAAHVDGRPAHPESELWGRGKRDRLR